MNAPRPDLSIVLPAYAEADHLADSLATIRTVTAGLGKSFEIVVIDDGSPDDTWAVLQGLVKKWPELRAFRLARNFGKEAALRAGLEASRGEAAIIMDADMQHPPDLIPELARLWSEEGYEIVNAVKSHRGRESWARRLFARIFYRAFERLAGVTLSRSTDFKLLSRRAVHTYCDLPERETFFRGLVAWMGFRQTSVSFDVAPRAGGETKWSFVGLTALALNSITSFSAIPLHMVTVLGVGFFVFALLLGGQTFWLKLAGKAVPGFTTVILLLIIIGAILMIALGIIGQYLAKIYDEVKRRPRYLIREEAVSTSSPPKPASDKGRTGRKSRATNQDA